MFGHNKEWWSVHIKFDLTINPIVQTSITHLFLSSRISLFLAWSSAIIGAPPIPPPCVTTKQHTKYIMFPLQVLKT